MSLLTAPNTGSVLGSGEVSPVRAGGKRKSLVDEAGGEEELLLGFCYLLSDEK